MWDRKIQGENSWPQFLVLYEDGNMRLKPHPPQGRPDVCFGSSVIIGPAPLDPSPEPRPYVDIREVRVNPTALSLDITYRNGESAHATLSVDRAQAVAEVEVGYTISADTPFATFRSMFVDYGNADVDHIQAPAGDFPILGGWSPLEGPWWFFHREVRSQHNTSAPDIRIAMDTIGTAAVFRVTREGDVYADGSFSCGLQSGCFNTTGADIAERIKVSEPVEPGDLVAIDPQEPNHYRKSHQPYSPLAVGVVSSSPGCTLANRPQELASNTSWFRPSKGALLNKLLSQAQGNPAPLPLRLTVSSLSKPLINTAKASLAQLLRASHELEWDAELLSRPLMALMGQVPVKATTENGPIQPGDLLVSAPTPGHVMKCADPQECQGAIIGKALEPLQQGTGLILMLMMR